MSTTPAQSISDELIAEIEAAANQATPGPWTAYDTHGKRFIESVMGECHVVCDTPRKQWLIDSVFIARANPSTILTLITRLREAEQDAARLEWMISEQCIMRFQSGTRSPAAYSLWWSALSEGQCEWFPSSRAAIDAAMQEQQP